MRNSYTILARKTRVNRKVCRFIFIDTGEAGIGPHRAHDYTTVSSHQDKMRKRGVYEMDSWVRATVISMKLSWENRHLTVFYTSSFCGLSLLQMLKKKREYGTGSFLGF